MYRGRRFSDVVSPYVYTTVVTYQVDGVCSSGAICRRDVVADVVDSCSGRQQIAIALAVKTCAMMMAGGGGGGHLLSSHCACAHSPTETLRE